MTADDPNLTAAEERASALLSRALRQLSADEPVQLDVARWVSVVPARRSFGSQMRLGFGVALAAVLVVGALAVTFSGLLSGPASSATSAVSLRHYDNGQFSFDYPAEWHDLSGRPDEIVLGTGHWCPGSPTSGCSEETIDISGGTVVLRVWQNSDTAPGYCSSPQPTGPTVEKHTEDSLHATQPTTRWEIRQPGYEFGAGGNVWVEAVTANPTELTSAQALVDSFRWDVDYCSSPSVAPSLPGTAGHFDNGKFSFDYPADWRAIAGSFDEAMANHVTVVLGTGVWHSGCQVVDNGVTCTGDTADVSGGRVVVKIFERIGGPTAICNANDQANATLGPNAVSESTENGSTMWEIRRPGYEFGWPNNIFVQAWTDGDQALAQVEALVASFRWATGIGTGAGSMCPSPSPAQLANYDSDGITFDYPATWKVISGYQHWGLHGPTIFFAVGTGGVDSNCQTTNDAQGSPNGVSCSGSPTARVTGDQVVVFWYENAHLFTGPLPTGPLGSNERMTTIDGQPAIEIDGPRSISWQISATDFIKAVWGPDAVDQQSQVQALIESFHAESWPASFSLPTSQ